MRIAKVVLGAVVFVATTALAGTYLDLIDIRPGSFRIGQDKGRRNYHVRFDPQNHENTGDDGVIKGTPQQLRDCGRMAQAANPSVTKSYRGFLKQSDGMDFDALLVQVHCSGICDDFHYTLRARPTNEWDLVLNEDASRRMNKTTDGQQASR